MKSFNCGIYRIRNNVNGKAYYGSSVNIYKRWVSHKNRLKNNNHHNIYLQRSWNKNGSNVFIFEYIEECDEEMLFEIEQKYIDENIGGYNIGAAGGGDNLTNHPDRENIIKRRVVAQQKILDAMSDEEKQERWARYGKNNPNWRDGGISYKICPSCNKNSIQTCSNVCGECRDRTGKNNPFYGKKHTKKTLHKLRALSTGVIKSKESIEKVTGENSYRFMGYYYTPWGVFPSSSQAQQAHEYMLSATIHRWCLNCDNIIVKQATSKSRYLKENQGRDNIGKSYRDLGFWFEPKQP